MTTSPTSESTATKVRTLSGEQFPGGFFLARTNYAIGFSGAGILVSDGTDNMIVDTSIADVVGRPTSDGSEASTFKIGGALYVSGNQPDEVNTGPFTMSVEKGRQRAFANQRCLPRWRLFSFAHGPSAALHRAVDEAALPF
jgi:hypothetical protein